MLPNTCMDYKIETDVSVWSDVIERRAITGVGKLIITSNYRVLLSLDRLRL